MSDRVSCTAPRMPNEITTRSQIPTQSTGGNEDLPPNYAEILDEVKREVRTGYVRAQRAANTAMIAMYWRIGKIIADRQAAEGWGAKVVKYLATDLKTAYPGQLGFAERNLRYMLKLARTWPYGIMQQPAAQLLSSAPQPRWSSDCLLASAVGPPTARGSLRYASGPRRGFAGAGGCVGLGVGPPSSGAGTYRLRRPRRAADRVLSHVGSLRRVVGEHGRAGTVSASAHDNAIDTPLLKKVAPTAEADATQGTAQRARRGRRRRYVPAPDEGGPTPSPTQPPAPANPRRGPVA